MAIWQWFQKTYDRIQGWDWSPEMKETIQVLNDKLPPMIAKALLKYIAEFYASSESVAKVSLRSIRSILDEAIEKSNK